MIKVNYDATTGAIKGFYPDDIAYANIRSQKQSKHYTALKQLTIS